MKKIQSKNMYFLLGLLFVFLFNNNGLANENKKLLYDNSKREQDLVINTLKKLVNIETGTGNAKGLKNIKNFLEKKLKDLGGEVLLSPAKNGVIGNNIVGTFKGNGGKKLLLMAHMDTVYISGTLEKSPFHIKGNKAYGPGIADDKSGIAIILHTLKLLKENNFKDFGSITVMFNTDEEKGSFGSRDLIKSLSTDNDYILSFEPTSSLNESFAYGASGIAYVEAKVKGKASHAGFAPEQGINALVEASNFILLTKNLDQKCRELRFNWTMAKSGEVTNIIPDEAIISANVRYGKSEDLENLFENLKERASKKLLPKSEIKVSIIKGRPEFNVNNKGKKLIDKAIEIYREVDGKANITKKRQGFGSDAAYAALTGKPVIEQLGLPGFGYHSNSEEYILINAIPKRLYLATRLIMELGKTGN